MNGRRGGTCRPWRCSLGEGGGGADATPGGGRAGGPSAVPRLTCVFRDPQVNFYVADVEGMARFYRDVLGFTETFRTPAEGTPVPVEPRMGAFGVGMAGIDAARAMHGPAPRCCAGPTTSTWPSRRSSPPEPDRLRTGG